MILKSSRDRRLIFKMKTSTETVNNSNVLQWDDDLVWTAVVDKSYAFWLTLWITSPAAQDIRMQIVAPNATGKVDTYDISGHGWGNLNANLDHATDGTLQPIWIHGILNQAITSETVGLKWCQLAPAVADTQMQVGSSLMVVQL